MIRTILALGQQNSCGFIVLALSQKEADKTIESIKYYYVGCPYVSLVYNKNLIAQINNGLKSPPHKEWNFIVFGGKWLRQNLDSKFLSFTKNYKEILFPITRRKNNFIDADINGMFFNKKAYKDLGEIPDMKTLEISKTIWAIHAISKGYSFLGISGASIS